MHSTKGTKTFAMMVGMAMTTVARAQAPPHFSVSARLDGFHNQVAWILLIQHLGRATTTVRYGVDRCIECGIVSFHGCLDQRYE